MVAAVMMAGESEPGGRHGAWQGIMEGSQGEAARALEQLDDAPQVAGVLRALGLGRLDGEELEDDGSYDAAASGME